MTRETMPLRIAAITLALFLLPAPSAMAQEVRPGVSAGSKVEDLGLPTQGYQVYLIGEMHGVEETQDFLMQYLALLHKTSGLRDVALEEKGVYEEQAQAYVDGRSDTLPESLCLRADILGRIRTFNAGLPPAQHIRVHFTDVDSPAEAIRQHLVALQGQIPGAAGVRIPAASGIKEHGLQAVARLQRFPQDAHTRSQLRTVEYSIRAYQQGFEVGTGLSQGSSYLEDREQAVASNIEDLARSPEVRSLLLLYGGDHVSRAMRKDGGPARNQPFAPTALRLQQAGIRVFCIETLPLSGRTYWRGHAGEIYWTASDARLHSGETFDKVLASAPQARFFYIDMEREALVAPSLDLAKFVEDAWVFFSSGTPLTDHCPAPSPATRP